MGLAVADKSEEKKSKTSSLADAGSIAEHGEHSCGASAGVPRFLSGGCGCKDCAQRIQAKLVMDTPGDRWEQEADRAAEAAATGRPSPMFGGGISRLTSTKAGMPSADSGSKMSADVRSKVEPVVGRDLSHVRVHNSPADRELAGSFNAKAFTHGSDIWLGPDQSGEDTRLMAHEAAHVVQQGAAGPTPQIQRQTATHSPSRAHGGSGSMHVSDPAIGDMVKDLPPRSAGPPPRLADAPDPKEVQKKNAQLQGSGHAAVAHANKDQAKLRRAASDAKAEANKPAKPDKKGDAKKGKEGKGKGAPPRHGLPIRPFTAPVKPPTVKPPEIVAPVDAAGKPLRPDPAGDLRMLQLAAQAQAMRMQGHALRERAAQERHNASVLQANIQLIHEGTTHAGEGLAHADDHLAYRHTIVDQASASLKLSEGKAEMVASRAPEFSDKAAENKEKSGPMSSEAKDLVGQNASATPDDDDAAEKSAEQGHELGSVGSDIGSMDDAITQTKAKADNLAQEAAQAKQTNTKTKGNIDSTKATLEKTQVRLTQLTGDNATAKAKLAQQAHGPSHVLAGAAALDKQGEAAIKASNQMEERIHAAQKKHVEAMHSVPASKIGKRGNAARPAALIQRQAASPEPAPAERINLDLAGGVVNNLPSWLTGEEKQTEEQRAKAQLEEQKRRESEIQEINTRANGNFANLSAADKAGIALSLTSRHIFGSLSNIRWPDMLSKMAQALIDPRISLMGVVSGLSMTLSGLANLVSIEQWKKDPLGNLLKSAADISTGIAIVLGSIAGLAVAIIAIMVLAAIFSFGALGPVAAAVIPFCSTVASTVGGWTLWAAAIALGFNFLVMIKDLVSAATAKTASDLQVQADHLTEDTKNAGNMAMQLGMAGLAKVGGKALMSTRVGQSLAAGARDMGNTFGEVYGFKPAAAPGAAASAAEARPPVSGEAPAAPASGGSTPRPVETPQGTPAAAADAAPSVKSSGSPAPAEGTPAPAADAHPTAKSTAPPAAAEGKPPSAADVPGAKSPAPATPAEATTAPKAEQPAPAKAEATPSEAPEKTAPESKAAEPVEAGPKPEDVAAEQPGAKGHKVKVTKKGECLICTDCENADTVINRDLETGEVPPAEKTKIRGDLEKANEIEDPVQKAQAAAEVQKETVEAVDKAEAGGTAKATKPGDAPPEVNAPAKPADPEVRPAKPEATEPLPEEEPAPTEEPAEPDQSEDAAPAKKKSARETAEDEINDRIDKVKEQRAAEAKEMEPISKDAREKAETLRKAHEKAMAAKGSERAQAVAEWKKAQAELKAVNERLQGYQQKIRELHETEFELKESLAEGARRETYLGKTPGKASKAGLEVQARMREAGTLRNNAVTGEPEFLASNDKWYPLEDADMAHYPVDAVTYWNETGRKFGPKSTEVRQWMNSSKNYTLDHYSLNRSAGARLGQEYLPPL